MVARLQYELDRRIELRERVAKGCHLSLPQRARFVARLRKAIDQVAAHEEEARPRPQRVDSRDRELQQRELFVPRRVAARVGSTVEHAELRICEGNEVVGSRPGTLACKGECAE